MIDIVDTVDGGPTVTFEARSWSYANCCDGQIEPGDEVLYVDDVLVHWDCL